MCQSWWCTSVETRAGWGIQAVSAQWAGLRFALDGNLWARKVIQSRVEGGFDVKHLLTVRPRPFIRLLAITAIVIAFTSIALAQSNEPPCSAMSENRTITFCFPIDDATVTADSVLDSGWVTDSQPYTATVYLDGKDLGGVTSTGYFTGEISYNFDDLIHTLTVVVTDSSGTFQRSSSFRQSLALPCTTPANNALNFCIPGNGAVTTSPLRVAAVANSSDGISWLQVWVDGVKYYTDHDTGTADVKSMNDHIYLAPGTHSVTMIAKESDGTSLKQTANVTIVAP